MSRRQPTEAELEAKRKEKRINRSSTITILIAIAIGSLITFIILQNSTTPLKRLAREQTSQNGSLLKLMAFVKTGQELAPLQGQAATGDVIAFKLATTRPIHIALAASVNDSAPSIYFDDTRIPPGPERLVEVGEDLFTYQIHETDAHVTFCVLSAEDSIMLSRLIVRLPTAWEAMPEGSCVKVR